MPNLYNGDFYDYDYYERGKESGKGWLTNYKWMPRRSIKEALAFIETLNLDETSNVLDFGCAKGFLVKAFRILDIKADGCDISRYALSFAPDGCWDCSIKDNWNKNKYTHIVSKDVFEHLTKDQLQDTLIQLKSLSKMLMCVVPIGDSGIYRIKEYHTEISHLIAEDEQWWKNAFETSGWIIKSDFNHVSGLKDNWQSFANGCGNHVFVLNN